MKSPDSAQAPYAIAPSAKSDEIASGAPLTNASRDANTHAGTWTSVTSQLEKEKGGNIRTSQIVFGERQHLLRVLDSLEGTDLPLARAQQERRSLEELIHARTRELNQINTAFDHRFGDGHSVRVINVTQIQDTVELAFA